MVLNPKDGTVCKGYGWNRPDFCEKVIVEWIPWRAFFAGHKAILFHAGMEGMTFRP